MLGHRNLMRTPDPPLPRRPLLSSCRPARWLKSCPEQQGPSFRPSARPQSHDRRLPSNVQSCLIDSLGRETVQKLFEGQRLPSKAELETLESCGFDPVPGLAPGGSSARVSPGVLEELERCLIDTLGEDVYADVTGGARRPTPEETRVFATCHQTVEPLMARAAAEASGYGEITLPQGCREESRWGRRPADNLYRFPTSGSETWQRNRGLNSATFEPSLCSTWAVERPPATTMGTACSTSTRPTQPGSNGLYRNNGDGTFTDEAVAAGVADPAGVGNAAGWGDYDNDGDLDLFVANYGTSKLFSNGGDGTFTDVTAAARVGDPDSEHRTMGVAWGDYDRDGRIDLLVVRHVSEADSRGVRHQAVRVGGSGRWPSTTTTVTPPSPM